MPLKAAPAAAVAAAGAAARAAPVTVLDEEDEGDDELVMMATSASGGGAAAAGGGAKLLPCAVCGEQHDKKSSLTLTNCKHTAGRKCLETLFNAMTPSVFDRKNTTCPKCDGYISWMDFQSAVGAERHVAQARRLWSGCVQFWDAPTLPCCESGRPCGKTLTRPKFSPLACNQPGNLDSLILLSCLPGCGSIKCTACGARFSAEAHKAHPHKCMRGVLLRSHLYLECLRLSTEESVGSAAQPAKKRKTAPKSMVWGKGTGFGGDSGSSMAGANLSQAKQRQDEQDAQIRAAMLGLIHQLSRAEDHPPALAAPPVVVDDPDFPSVLPQAAASKAPCLFSAGEDAMRLQALLSDSCLHEVLRKLLWNSSSLDVTNRLPLYSTLVELLNLLSSKPLLATQLNTPCPFARAWRTSKAASEAASAAATAAASAPATGTTTTSARTPAKRRGRKAAAAVPSAMEGVVPGAADAGSAAAAAAATVSEDHDDSETVTPLLELMAVQDKQARIFLQQSRGVADLAEGLALFERIRSTYKAMQAALQALPHFLRGDRPVKLEEGPAEAAASSGAAAAAEADAAYVTAMRPLLFHQCNIDYGTHVLNALINQSMTQVMRKERMAHITREITTLATSLPLNLSSSIFVRVDEDRPDVLKALITGPADTPYENGCFVFDIFLPVTYPDTPPQVRIVTTDNHRVRFNPNLYSCGKVCLSLLGTWQGPGWEPKVSTLLQVLVSIQSLILVPDPFYNEPGFDARQSKRESECYNCSLRFHTAAVAMLKALKEPVPEFRAVIRTHFQEKKEEIRRQIKGWRDDAAERDDYYKGNCGAHDMRYVPLSQWDNLLKNITAELDRLLPADTITLD